MSHLTPLFDDERQKRRPEDFRPPDDFLRVGPELARAPERLADRGLSLEPRGFDAGEAEASPRLRPLNLTGEQDDLRLTALLDEQRPERGSRKRGQIATGIGLGVGVLGALTGSNELLALGAGGAEGGSESLLRGDERFEQENRAFERLLNDQLSGQQARRASDERFQAQQAAIDRRARELRIEQESVRTGKREETLEDRDFDLEREEGERLQEQEDDLAQILARGQQQRLTQAAPRSRAPASPSASRSAPRSLLTGKAIKPTPQLELEIGRLDDRLQALTGGLSASLRAALGRTGEAGLGRTHAEELSAFRQEAQELSRERHFLVQQLEETQGGGAEGDLDDISQMNDAELDAAIENERR